MSGQISYYNKFADKYRSSILDCPEPEYWTTDYDEKGKVYREIKERVDLQKEWVLKYFKKNKPVLDIGCGFARQAYWMAKSGFNVEGIDTSESFISLAKELFQKKGLTAKFSCIEIFEMDE